MKVKGVWCEPWKWGRNAVPSVLSLSNSFPQTLCVSQYQKFSCASHDVMPFVAKLSSSSQAPCACSWQRHSMCSTWQKAIFCWFDVLKLPSRFVKGKTIPVFPLVGNWGFFFYFQLFHKTCRNLVFWRLVASVKFGLNWSWGSKSNSHICLDPRGNLSKMYDVRSEYLLFVWVIWDFGSKTCFLKDKGV